MSTDGLLWQRETGKDGLQAAVIQYLSWALPADAVANHAPGEGKRTRRAQGELKRSGYQRGWPDIEIVWQSRIYFIELKAAAGVMSDAQRDMHRKLRYCGADVLLCRSLEGVGCALRGLGVPLRGSVAA